MRRALLVSLRLPTDPMVAHEHRCFAERGSIGLDELDLHFMHDGMPSRDLLAAHEAVFFGGSGEFSVLDDLVWIRRGLDALIEVVDLGVPTYASCFGFQGLALALGGRVERDDDLAEMGTTPLWLTEAGKVDSLFSGLPEHFKAQEGHHDHVLELPPGVTLLASSATIEAQALRVEGKPIWASQFHPELDLDRCLDRFRHYGKHYLDDGRHDDQIANMRAAGPDSPEVATLLSRLVRHDF